MELQKIQNKIYTVRNQNVMLDFDLAVLYDVETRVLKQAVRRNPDRFPEDFMFELTRDEFNNLTSQNVISSHGGMRYLPFAFTEQGVAMLSSVLRSKKAIVINISIMRAFVYIRQYALNYKDLNEKLDKLDLKYNKKFREITDAIRFLLTKNTSEEEQSSRKKIGYK